MEKSKSISNKADNGFFTIITKALTSSKIPKINVADAAAQKSSYVFLDSREKVEFDVSHIKNAIFTGASDFNYQQIQNLSKNTKIIVYCSVGVRSDQIAKKLIDAGYRDVQNLFGGIFEWINEGHPVYSPSGNETDSVHAYSKMWGVFVNSDHKVY